MRKKAEGSLKVALNVLSESGRLTGDMNRPCRRTERGGAA